MAVGLYNSNIYGLNAEAEIYVAQGVVMCWNFCRVLYRNIIPQWFVLCNVQNLIV